MDDCEKCFEIDPDFIKAYVRLGTCHLLMQDFASALATYDAGLEIEPQNKDLLQGKQQTMMFM